MVEDELTLTLLEKFVFPLVVGIVGWFIKDYLFALYARRDELVRKEWERRLLEVWSPLYYWTGIVLMDSKQTGWDRHGLRELESILSKNAHLLPARHFNTLIKLVQTLTNQKTTGVNVNDLTRTQRFVYDKIETLNYLLYRKSGWFEATTYTDFFASAKYLIRFISQALKHIVVWLTIIALFGIPYLAYENEQTWIVLVIATIVLIPIFYDWYRQIKLHRELHRRSK